LKLSFYEGPDESGFFSKMFSEGNEKALREALVKAYTIIEEIYDDLLTPYRLK